jgi:hypothetical protein
VLTDADSKTAGFGLMLRDDCYAPVKDASILSNFVATGILNQEGKLYGNWSRENSALNINESISSTTYALADTAVCKIIRLGQRFTCSVTYKGQTYTKEYNDFDIQAIDNSNLYIGIFATRGTVVETSDLSLQITGISQGA